MARCAWIGPREFNILRSAPNLDRLPVDLMSCQRLPWYANGFLSPLNAKISRLAPGAPACWQFVAHAGDADGRNRVAAEMPEGKIPRCFILPDQR